MRTFFDRTLTESRAHGVGIKGGLTSPSIQPKHIDGPFLHFSDAQMHWLSPWERILFFFGLTDAEKLQRKLRPRLTAELDAMVSRKH